MHYYNFHIADYRKDTMHLTPMEHFIYRSLLDWMYLNECPIPKENQKVLRWLGLVSENNQLLENVLQDYFIETENGYIQERVMREIEEYNKKIETLRANGSKGGRPKKTKRFSNANQKETKSKPNVKVTNNHKPITINIPFDDFWSNYPNKKGRVDAEKKWPKLSDQEREKALADCRVRYQETEKQFIPHGSTYLNKKPWNDELPSSLPSDRFAGFR